MVLSPTSLGVAPPRVHDACGILGGLAPRGAPLSRFVRMLNSMSHRGGDGIGFLFRMAPEIFESELARAPYRDPDIGQLAAGVMWPVLTLQVPAAVEELRAIACTREVLARHGFAWLYAIPVSRPTRDDDAVRTWRFVMRDVAPAGIDRVARRVLAARREFEARAGSDGLPLSFFPVSFSTTGMVLYKQVGSMLEWVESFGRGTLERTQTDCFIAHVRYSTNTLPRHRSAQPFGLLAHNGEINNIGALRRAMRDRGVPLSGALSDSADLFELAEELSVEHRLELSEVFQVLFPRRWPDPIGEDGRAAWHARLSRASRPVRAEGPAALVATDGHCLVGRVDNLGLRPLICVRTKAGEVFFASEAGAVARPEDCARVKRLRPGEMVSVLREGSNLRVVTHLALEARMRRRFGLGPARTHTALVGPRVNASRPDCGPSRGETSSARPPTAVRRIVSGFTPRVRKQLETLFLDGREIGSGTGWRNGLAVARGPGTRLADALHAMTAQVTAPTISAEHEMAAMDGRTVLGPAPSLTLGSEIDDDLGLTLALPILLADEGTNETGTAALEEAVGRLGTLSLTNLRVRAGSTLREIDARLDLAQVSNLTSGAARLRAALDQICAEAVSQASTGVQPILLLLCTWGANPERAPLPPELVVGAVDHELTRRGLRRSVSLVVASESISDPHTMFVLLQLGADALIPILLGEEGLELARRRGRPLASTLEHGMLAIAKALFIMYGRIATSELAAGRGGRRLCPVGLDVEIGHIVGLGPSVGTGCGLEEVWEGLRLRSQAMAGDEGALSSLAEASIDTMPLDASLASYALLGGFNPSPGRRPRSPGQLRLAQRTLLEAIGRQQQDGRGMKASDGESAALTDAANPASVLEWVDNLSIERRAELHMELFAPLRAGAYGFLDSLELASAQGSQDGDWRALASGLDGRHNNQILGAISYGANNRIVHELYALVMARSGAMSNGGEGGVPDHVRALFVTARLSARGASAAALATQLSEEVPTYLEGLDAEARVAQCRRLLETVPKDFAASRFEQISTARFGVDAYAFHDARFLEIKIGQGAKPGVGGSLPGEKVLPAIAATRGVNPGQTLNSPTVHHDIYSIEDLRQLVTALKTFNPEVRVSVKLAAMDDLDVIALGVVKAGADFIWIDGYEGGTGSAKDAHKAHCGLPAAPVIRQVHEALLAQGMRGGYRHSTETSLITRHAFHRLESREQAEYHWIGPRIIGSGGVRCARDALKLMFTGADYVGYGDAAQNAVGCIRCEKCHTGRCPSYVATNEPRRSEAFDVASGEFTLTRFVEVLDVGMRKLAANIAPGIRHLEELVGRTDLLRQAEQARLRVDARFFEPVLESDSASVMPVDPGRDAAAVRRPAGERLEAAFADWRRDIHRALSDQGLDLADPNALADLGPGTLQLPDALRRLAVEVRVDNRDRLLGTAIVRPFIELRRLTRLATGIELDLALRAHGAAGSGFGMFAVHGMDLTLVGCGGDYLGEAIHGAHLFVLPAVGEGGRVLPGSGDAGNASVYGMRGGEVHVFDQPGTRFGIRLSGGHVFVWGDPERVDASFAADVVKPQFTAEYMTRGTLVLCRDPGQNLLCAATGTNTEILCRRPDALEREDWARELTRRIPDSFEASELEDRHVALIAHGARRYCERARLAGIEGQVTPLLPDEDPRASFVLLRERRPDRDDEDRRTARDSQPLVTLGQRS